MTTTYYAVYNDYVLPAFCMQCKSLFKYRKLSCAHKIIEYDDLISIHMLRLRIRAAFTMAIFFFERSFRNLYTCISMYMITNNPLLYKSLQCFKNMFLIKIIQGFVYVCEHIHA